MIKEKKLGISLIDKELMRFDKQIQEIYAAMESIDLIQIPDIEDRLRGGIAKANLLKQLPVLIAQLEELRNKRLKQDDIKGSTMLSPLDDGTLD